MAELLENEEGGVFGAVNELDTVLSRGEGLFDVNYDQESVRDAWKERKICEGHRKELSTQWENHVYYHYYYPRSSPSTNYRKRYCSFPEAIEWHIPRPILKNKIELNKDETFALLKKEGLLLHVGLR